MLVSRFLWVGRAFAPWCVAAGLVVSFTASAGHDGSFGASRADKAAHDSDELGDYLPARRALLGAGSFFDALPDGAIQRARLVIGDTADLAARPDEVEPRIALKRNGAAVPEIDRSHRGDPFIGLRPSIDVRWRAPAGADGRRASLIFDVDDALPVANFTAGEGDVTGPGPVLSFEIVADNDNFSTRRPAVASRDFGDGSTPLPPRAVLLGATTPVALDMAPIEIAGVAILSTKATTGRADETLAERKANQPDYAALIDASSAKREEKCLAEAIYFEARSESEAGQAAVAQVVLNRVNSNLYPSTVCGVVYQNRSHYKACQFSFACEGKSLRVTEPEPWAMALRIAREVTAGKTYLADVGPSTHYHAGYVRPRWASRLKKMDKIGNHIFYKLRPGQT